jgi:hypothetical protein
MMDPMTGQTTRARNALHHTARLGGVLLALAAAAAITAAAAAAAPYVAWSCASPTGSPLGANDWTPARTAPVTTISSTCGTATGTLEASASASEQNPSTGAGAGWTIAAPDGAKITSLDVWWTNAVNPISPPPFGRIQIYAAAPGSDGSAYQRDDGTFGAAGDPFGDANYQGFPNLAAPSVTLMAWCVSFCTAPARVTALYALYRSRVVVEDPSPPTGAVSGLPDTGRIAGATPIAVDATDVGGGVRALELRVDDQLVGRVDPGGSCADLADVPFEYATVKPCPARLPATLTLDPALLPGTQPHRVSIVAVDAAGQSSTLMSRLVAAAAPAALFASDRGFFNPDLDLTSPRTVNGAGGGPANVTFDFIDSTVRFGETPVLIGHLTTPEGQPIAGARVWRAVAGSRGAWEITGQPLVTSPTGRIGGWMPPRQPSRSVALLYFPYSDASDIVLSPVRRLRVAAGVTLHPARRIIRPGSRARFAARLAVEVGTGASVRALLQVHSGRRWHTLRRVRFRHGSRTLRPVVRFPRSRPRATYHLRLLVPAQRGFPYGRGTSQRAVVFVRR